MSTVTLLHTPQEALQALATFVRAVRLNREMTLEELALRTGVSRSSLIRLEKNGAGSTETQVRILAALGVLDVFVSAFEPPEKQLSVAQLKKMSTTRQRQRGKRRKHDIS
jgi:transcriptional regulator with XRE-family HTH domain